MLTFVSYFLFKWLSITTQYAKVSIMTVTRTNSLNIISFQVLSDNKCKPSAPPFQKRVTVLFKVCLLLSLFLNSLSFCYLDSVFTYKFSVKLHSFQNLHQSVPFIYQLYEALSSLQSLSARPPKGLFLQLTDLPFPAAASNQLSNTVPHGFPSTSPSWNKRGERATGGREGERRGNNMGERRKPKLVEGKKQRKREWRRQTGGQKRLKSRKGGN